MDCFICYNEILSIVCMKYFDEIISEIQIFLMYVKCNGTKFEITKVPNDCINSKYH